MIYGDVCSGIGVPSLAWRGLGWRPAFFSETDKFPRAVLKHHWPDVPLHGDFTSIKDGDYEPIEILVGGTPCQDFSVAGLRKGITGARGNLTIEFVNLLERLHSRWFVWENVPGVLSIDKGRAFGMFLARAAGYGDGFIIEPPAEGWGNAGIIKNADAKSHGLAFRVLDAQFFGVPQRRRRLYVVGHIGNWRAAAAVLFESESLRGDPAPSREAGKRIAPTISARPTGGGGLGTDFDLDGGLIAQYPRADGFDASEDGTGRGTPLITSPSLDCRSGRSGENSFATSGGLVPEVSPALKARDYKGPSSDGDDAPIITCAGPIPFDTTQITSKTNRSNPQPGQPSHALAAGADATAIAFDCKASGSFGFSAGEQAPPLRSMNAKDSNANAGGQIAVAFEARIARNGRGRPEEIAPPLKAQSGETGKGDSATLIAIPILEAGGRTGKSTDDPRAGLGVGENDDPMFTLQSQHQHAVALDLRNAMRDPDKLDKMNRQGCGIGDDLANTLSSAQSHGVSSGMAVRRLTPIECERLQGVPDNHTLIPFGKNRAKDFAEWFSYLSYRIRGLDENYARNLAADGPRYKALGNAMPRPVVEWIGQRIEKVQGMIDEKN